MNGVQFDGVLVHPNRKLRSLRYLPQTVWIQLGCEEKIFDFAESLGYNYKQSGKPTVRRDNKIIQYQKYKLIDKNQISGFKKPWH